MNLFSIEDLQENKNKILFGTLVLITLFAVAFLVVTGGSGDSRPNYVTNNSPYVPSKESIDYLPFINENKLLQESMLALQALDEQYVTVLSTGGSKTSLDSVNEQINSKEKQLSITMDSLSFAVLNMPDNTLGKAYKELVSQFKQLLSNRRTTNIFFRTASAGNSDDFKPDQLATLQFKRQLDEKNNQIEQLTASLQQTIANKNAANKTGLPTGGTKESAAAQDDKTTANLITAYNNLKLDYDKLVQQTQAKALANNEEAALTQKTNALQQKLNQLNAELRLAAVDCNLSRVDAAKIIYTSRQRKDLLSETSVILKDLSAVDDASIQKKVRDKIIRLNQVAANSRD